MSPKRTASHETGTEAENLLRSQLPSSWVLNPITVDYGIDFNLQVFIDGRSTPLEIYIQLKGARRIKTSSGEIRIDIRVANLLDYEKRRIPVFLVVSDVSSQKCYYLHAQKALYSLEQGWDKRRRITIRVPCANLLSDHDSLLASIIEADRFTAGLHPTALESAVSHETSKLRRLDPRFSVSLDYIAGKRSIRFAPISPVTLTVTIPKTKAVDLIDRGLPVKFLPGELNFHGSELFSEITQGGGTLHFAISKTFHADVLMSLSSGVEIPIFNSVPMKAEGGQEEIRMHGNIGDLAKVHYRVEKSGDKLQALGSLTISLSTWSGLSVASLPHFTRLKTLFDHAKLSDAVVLRIEDSGNFITEGRIKPTGLVPTPALEHLLGLLEKTRAIASALAVKIVYPGHSEAFTDTDSIEFVHFITSSDKPHRHRPGFEVKQQVPREWLKKWTGYGIDKKGLLQYEVCCDPFGVWGTTIDLHEHCGRIMAQVTDVYIANGLEEIKAFLESENQKSDFFTITLRATESSVQSFTKHATDATFQQETVTS